ncbi:hypothetical protein EGW08_007558 [Elysia chlorotica]|uniref:Dual oxidase maturation factor 1 n=1 Tax=Elysia chlorotica TaxID=188477 RepID=A0A3S1BC05_ELYCH|nr:hypothetical protein EGW08_007558 [Elysia chlorotica]
MSAWFKEFRNEHGFTSYPDNETPVTVDMALLAVTYFCVLLSVATLIATLGIRGREKWSAALRAGYAVAVGSIILVCLVGHGWQQGDVHITSPYVYRSNLPFKGSVGLRVGLHGTNVTLDGYYQGASGTGYVYYVEEMPWADFGQGAERYTHFLHRGLPEPVLKVMEYVSIDSGGLRWGRSFQTAGHFANVLLWTAFAFWLVTNLLLFSVVVYGAYMFFFTGLTMVLACIAYHACQLDQPLVITFGDVDLRVSYGWSFWLSLATGCITLVLGLALIVFDHFAHEGVADFFKLEKLDEDDYLECEERKLSQQSMSYILDRRGNVVPPPDSDRRGSIFLEPSRRPSRYNEILLKSLGLVPAPAQIFAASRSGMSPSRSSCSLSKVDKMAADFDGRADSIKANPVYGVETKKLPRSISVDKDADPFCEDMEYVCKPNKVSSSTAKPSLATLREHRDNHANHANEKISASTTAMGQQVRTPDPGQVSTLNHFQRCDEAQTDTQVSDSYNSQQRRQSSTSDSAVIHADVKDHGSTIKPEESSTCEQADSTTASPYATASDLPDNTTQASVAKSTDPTRWRKQSSTDIVLEILSRQNSGTSSSSKETSSSSSADSGRGESYEKTWETGSGDGSDVACSGKMDTRFNTIMGSGFGKEVVVNIESSPL